MYYKLSGKPKYPAIIAFILILICLPLLIHSRPASQAQVQTPVNDLPRIDTSANLLELLKKVPAPPYRISFGGRMTINGMKSMDFAETAAPAAAAADYSATNVQVAGVDEADIIKTDGSYIYQVDRQKLTIIKACPASEMQVVNSFTFEDANFRASDIYADNDHLIIMGSTSYDLPEPYPWPRPGPMPDNNASRLKPSAPADIYPPFYTIPADTCKIMIYDIHNKGVIKKLREFELEGAMISTRKIGSSIYIAASQYIDVGRITDSNIDIPLPAYKDSIGGSDFASISLDRIRYFPDAIYPSYILIAALNLEDLTKPLDVKAYLGNGENIYASADNLYIAVSSYNYDSLSRDDASISSNRTSVYKFSLQPGATEYAGQGSVPGAILNQFSMDENGAYFRIATTSDGQSSDGVYTSRNNVYVLDHDLHIAGRLENIAPGERIYSARFMGDRAYMVTFRTVDPFFVIDLQNPAEPQVLGQLKIPGYSDYLHPYDENHIIGFGKDTIELKGWNGEPQAYYQGMKLALFDVTDVKNPREMARELIGDRGTDSELLHNHKALLFDRDKNLLAFPVTLMEIEQGSQPKNGQARLQYGHFTFQGAYIYNLDPVNGFKLQGRITHLDPEDYLKAGDYWYGSAKNISRILYINDAIYTISPAIIMAHTMDNLAPIKTLGLQ